jgi:hypothetical protein
MDINQQLQGHPDATATAGRTVLRNALIGFTVAIQLLRPMVAAPATTSAVVDTTPCCASASSTRTVDAPPPVAVTFSDSDRVPTPDATADYTGGLAARLHTTGSTPIPGNVFMLMATHGSDNPARLYDHTPYIHGNATAADAHDSNVDAAEAAEAITGADVDLLDFTTAPGGGSSAGITYTIAYLNVISDGAFTGNIRVAATGRLTSDGYVHPINAINEKMAAAHLADADVIFTPSTPDAEHLDTFSARHVGELFRARNTGSTLGDERRLGNYHTWGTTQPDGLDIVGIRHIADVAAYLCGNGATYACEVADHYEDTIIGAPAPSDGPIEASATLIPARLH